MKVLGLNFGRVNGACKELLREAVGAAAQSGAEVEIIDTIKYKINRCVGCGACSDRLMSGKGQIRCVQKDDFEWISDKVLEADATIVAAPVYVLAPDGSFKCFVDRFGPAHDKAFMLFENELRLENGGEPLNGNCLKRHLVGYISVGGAVTPNWVSFGLSQLNLFGYPVGMKVVGQVNAQATWKPDYRARFLAESRRLGAHMVEAYGQKNSEVVWENDPGACPVCHCKEMTLNGTTEVCCPVCGIFGTLKIEDGKLSVQFSEAEQRRSRLRISGLLEHQEELGRKGRYPRFDEWLEKYMAMENTL